MSMVLANAPIAPTSDSNVELVLVSTAIIMVVGIAAFIPVQLARRRRRSIESIVAITMLWAILTAGSVCFTVMQQMDWSKKLQEQIDSGYFDPADTTGKPNTPVAIWSGLGVCYGAIVVWAFRSMPKKGPGA